MNSPITTTIDSNIPSFDRKPRISNLSGSSRNGLLCASVVVACVLIAQPFANMPFIDGFSYAKTAEVFAQTGRFVYNGWATAMLGWQIPWGALFIKVFGFSFDVTRLSMLPIDAATVYLFHQVLRRFGIGPGKAILGALTLALSPLFLPLAASFMTDVPGLLIIVSCIYMCQRAVAAETDRAALLWLCSATAINILGGTVRQIAWLGALVMVPSTAWLLRDRYGMRLAGILLWLASLGGVIGFLHWFNRQPYSVPEHIIAGPVHADLVFHLAVQLAKTFLCLLLLVFPVSAMSLPSFRHLPGNAKIRIAGMTAIIALIAIFLSMKSEPGRWLAPWLTPILLDQGTWPIWVKTGLSLLVMVPAFVLVEQLIERRRDRRLPTVRRFTKPWKEMAWILVPFSVSYLILLMPRGTFAIIQDRYIEGLAILAIVALLMWYEERGPKKPSTIGVIVLVGFTVYSICGTHDFFAASRALVRSISIVEDSGISRRSIQAGMASDGWAQIEFRGHINDPRIQVPAGAYNPHAVRVKISSPCLYWFESYTPAITPEFSIGFPQSPCFTPTSFPPVGYAAWLPPFHGVIYVQKSKSMSNY